MKVFGLELRLPRRAEKAAVSPITLRDLVGRIMEPFAGAWQRNLEIDNKESILAFSAVYACVSRIANDISKLRIMLTSIDENGIWSEVGESPYWKALKKPNRYQNRIQFLTDWLCMKLIHGNAYILKEREPSRGIVRALYVLDSRRVKPLVTPDGGVYYQISSDYLAGLPQGVTLPASEVIHDRCPALWHPLCGVPPLYACARSATQGNRIQTNSATFFDNMSRPSGILSAPGLIDDVTAARLKQEWEQNFGGGNLGRLAVAGNDLKYIPITIPAEQAQLIQQLNWTVEDVARAFGVPLYKINSGPVPTSNNVEALEQQYYTGCLQVLIESIELCLDEGMELPNGYGTRLDLDGLLRMDSTAQIDFLEKAVKGVMSANEARRKLNLAPTPGGAAVLSQQQNFSLQALAKRDASEDPFGKQQPAPAPAPAPSDDSDEEVVDVDQAREMIAHIRKGLELA
ncbi:phage portal protein [Variovorax sp. JS1663]|nr:phage portal protein [Variovorax sp. JS1663]